MRLFRHLSELSHIKHPVVLALGVFDGVHMGHQEVIREAVRRAREIDGDAAVITFHPHPSRILRPDSAPFLLTTEQQDYELFSMLDVDHCVILDFNLELSRQSPEQFLCQLKGAIPNLKCLVVGPGWHFGHERAGNYGFLKQWAEKNGIQAVQMEPVMVEYEAVSSTRIRQLIAKGEIPEANKRLGRPYQILGKVVHGEGLGSALGIPTINLEVENELIPCNGVYAARALFEGEVRAAAVNIGFRPTVSDAEELAVEAFLLNFSGDLYGHHVRLDFLARIRDEQKFNKLEELVRQILSDSKTALVHAYS